MTKLLWHKSRKIITNNNYVASKKNLAKKKKNIKLHRPGIEPGAQRWQRWILPLNHRCLFDEILKTGCFHTAINHDNLWIHGIVYKLVENL